MAPVLFFFPDQDGLVPGSSFSEPDGTFHKSLYLWGNQIL